ncbi:lysine-sensitive aspartokinase 3 [Catenovulum sp. 2E275]|uniref:lysine-sensitive aspartokinase 3 n=1 Tax=Catenovulum sp. 2E275 TaxID=2980497 RepID=UPI0021D060E5|nr:lysine-sensitive aspartokinase 3 [Catenovulum sp. 2E275]MCU4674895.1 lysine-sensitive aspartokinase 3 [Catenovulum sp. 2E275]
MKNLIVAKFGGTSVANFEAMSRCADIVLADSNIRVVCVSAQSGVTNRLVSLTRAEITLAERETTLTEIREIEYAIVEALGKPEWVCLALDNLLNELKTVANSENLVNSMQLKDQIQSYGEQMSSLLFAEVMRQRGAHAVNFDIRQVLKTDNNYGKAEPNVEQTRLQAEKLIAPELEKTVFITQGFIGSDDEGHTTTLGRGGSDYSAALIAEALDAETLQIWTDVTGIYTTDPRLTQAARPIPEISFDEAAEMATFGAKILHPATLIPAIRRGVGVFVGSSREPKAGGTWILNQVENKPPYRAIALRKDQVLVTLKSPSMLLASGFLAKVFTILAEHKISVDLVTTSEISVSLTIDNPTNSTSKGLNPLVLEKLAEFCDVKVEDNLSLVAVIGNHLQANSGVGGKLLSALENFNLRMICQGASAHNFCFLTKTEDAGKVVEHLHAQLFDAI